MADNKDVTDVIDPKSLAALAKYSEEVHRQENAEAETERALSSALAHAEALTARLNTLVATKEAAASGSGLTTRDLERWGKRVALADAALERAIEKVEDLVAA